MSQKTGTHPASATAEAVAKKVKVGTSTSSPGLKRARQARWRAAVPEETATAWSAWKICANSFSNVSVVFPCRRAPAARASITSALPSSST